MMGRRRNSPRLIRVRPRFPSQVPAGPSNGAHCFVRQLHYAAGAREVRNYTLYFPLLRNLKHIPNHDNFKFAKKLDFKLPVKNASDCTS